MTAEHSSDRAQQLLEQLFNGFDRDGDGLLDFREVAYMLKQLDPAHSLRSARNAAFEALLICDADGDRRITEQEFKRLLSRLFHIAGISFEEGAQKLLDAVQASRLTLSPADAAVDQQLQDSVRQSDQTGSAHLPLSADSVHAQKLKALFHLWDTNGDGYVAFDELCHGLAKFKPIKTKQDITATFTEAARALKQFDGAGHQRLRDVEFESYITAFMAQAGFDFDDVVDHLIVVASKPECDVRLQRALDKSATSIQRLLSTSLEP